MKTRRVISVGLLALWFSAAPLSADLARETTQILNRIQIGINNVRTLDIYQTELRNLQYQLNLYRGMLRNLQRLEDVVDDVGIRDIKRLGKIIRAGRDVADSTKVVIAEHKRIYKDHQQHKEQSAGVEAEDAEAWSTYNQETIGRSLALAREQVGMLDSEQAAIDGLAERVRSGEGGTREALDGLFELTRLQLEQMQKLRILVAAQVEIDSVAAATETDRRAKEETGHAVMKAGTEAWGGKKTYEGGWGFEWSKKPETKE